jgi:hypothetical protein
MCVKETNEMADAGARIFEVVKETYYRSMQVKDTY